MLRTPKLIETNTYQHRQHSTQQPHRSNHTTIQHMTPTSSKCAKNSSSSKRHAAASHHHTSSTAPSPSSTVGALQAKPASQSYDNVQYTTKSALRAADSAMSMPTRSWKRVGMIRFIEEGQGGREWRRGNFGGVGMRGVLKPCQGLRRGMRIFGDEV